MSNFKYSVGPWNIHEGNDSFGPAVRNSISLIKKMEKFKSLGIDAIQFHDDDVVPNISGKTIQEIESETLEVKKWLDNNGLKAEFVAPRLWEDPRTVDGALTSNNKEHRQYAIERAKKSADIATMLDCDLIGFWFAREGTVCAESKDPVVGWKLLVDGINEVLEYHNTIKIFIEPKPNEPIDRSFCPTMGHAMALSSQTIDPKRVGGLVESAHAVLAGLDPAHEMACALAFNKLFGVHLNDQNSLKFDQDKSFGAENLRQAFNQVALLVNHGYGKNGEYIGVDVKAMRTQKDEVAWKHIRNSILMVKLLEEKVVKFDQTKRSKLISERDYEELEMYVMELLMGV